MTFMVCLLSNDGIKIRILGMRKIDGYPYNGYCPVDIPTRNCVYLV